MSKVRFADDIEDTPARNEAKAECARADNAVRQLRLLENRVRGFFGAVDHVVFASVETAPEWAEQPLAYVLDGWVPEPAPVAELPVEPDDGPDTVSFAEAGIGRVKIGDGIEDDAEAVVITEEDIADAGVVLDVGDPAVDDVSSIA